MVGIAGSRLPNIIEYFLKNVRTKSIVAIARWEASAQLSTVVSPTPVSTQPTFVLLLPALAGAEFSGASNGVGLVALMMQSAFTPFSVKQNGGSSPGSTQLSQRCPL